MKKKKDRDIIENADRGNSADGSKESGARARIIAAAAAVALAAAALGLAFVPLAGAGKYFLVASVLCGICALGILSPKKISNPCLAVKILRISAYVLLFAGVALFTGGIIYSAAKR